MLYAFSTRAVHRSDMLKIFIKILDFVLFSKSILCTTLGILGTREFTTLQK